MKKIWEYEKKVVLLHPQICRRVITPSFTHYYILITKSFKNNDESLRDSLHLDSRFV